MWYVKSFPDRSFYQLQRSIADGVANGLLPRETVLLQEADLHSNTVYLRTESPAFLAAVGEGFSPIAEEDVPRKHILLFADHSRYHGLPPLQGGEAETDD